MTSRKPATSRSVDYDTVVVIALALPGVEESTSYGTRALKVKGKLMARLKEDGVTLVLRTTFEDRALLMGVKPATFFITDHYRDHPLILIRLESVSRAEITQLIDDAWRLVAPRRLARERE
jgi:hypothetical protein